MLALKPERFALDDFITRPISVCGRTFLADQSGALYWPAEKTLIVADLHFEKGSAYASRASCSRRTTRGKPCCGWRR